MKVLALDPGPAKTGYCYWDGRTAQTGELENAVLLGQIRNMLAVADLLAVERIVSYGRPVGQETFDTCVWIGRFAEAWEQGGGRARLIPRLEVKLHICHHGQAKDGAIRMALIDRLGKPGTKRVPGPTYGVTGHGWQALALAICAAETEQEALATEAARHAALNSRLAELETRAAPVRSRREGAARAETGKR